ncbi:MULTISPECIES: hypothetical protein [unclassified Nonomuraea]|uniref:hypothetical protein n=1 Tax=unclassified Nonomuraea TaxID=2593643 RepID=UPI0033E878F0
MEHNAELESFCVPVVARALRLDDVERGCARLASREAFGSIVVELCALDGQA